MSVKIVTDSTCDLPDSIIAEHDISLVPLYINIGDESFVDGVDISREEFYRDLPSYDTPPMTASPAPETLRNIYQRLADGGATAILSIHISVSLSGTLNAARLAAREVTSIPVKVLDSDQLSMGTGFLVEAAAKAAEAGRSVGEIVDMVKEKTQRTHVFAALDTLEFLQRSGRMSWAVSRLGNLLKIKPLLKMNRGNPEVEKVRTHRRAMDRLVELVSDLGPLEELALVHTNAPEKLEELRERIKHLLPSDEEPIRTQATPVIGAHIGPGVVGVACVAAEG
jgi:DegV family protein with EDD domain